MLRRKRDRQAAVVFRAAAWLPFLLLVSITAVLAGRSLPILRAQSLWDLLLGTTWLPGQGKFGFLPFILGTAWVTGAAMLLALPVCLLSAIYLAEYARPLTRALAKPALDMLAGIPSVVYGVWGFVVIVPWVQGAAAPFFRTVLGWIPMFHSTNPTGYSILAGGIVLAVMVTPFIISMVYEVLRTVPAGLREASLAVGATHWQTIQSVCLPRSRTGILAGIVMGTSRALGETMAVLMVIGCVPHIPVSIFDPAYPLPALIANNYGEMLTIPLYDSALMSAALLLLVIVLIFNLIASLILHWSLNNGASARRFMPETLDEGGSAAV